MRLGAAYDQVPTAGSHAQTTRGLAPLQQVLQGGDDRRQPRGSWTFTSDYVTTRVVDHLDAELQGVLRLFSPILRRQFAQEGSRHLDGAVRRLEAAPAAPYNT